MNILYIPLKHLIWRFRIHIYFLEIFKFRNSTNTLKSFAKPVFAYIFGQFKYFGKQDIFMESPDHMLQNDIYMIC